MTDDSSTSVFSRELAEAVGYIVLEAADAEDSIAELVVLRSGLESPDPRWWRSGVSGGGLRLAMLRSKAAEPSFEVTASWSDGALAELAHQFRVLDRMADDAISDAMGLERSPGSPLPPRKSPVILPDRV